MSQKKFRAVYIPQVPMEACTVSTDSIALAAVALGSMVKLSIFEFEHRVKPDYSDYASIEEFVDGEWEAVDSEEWEKLVDDIVYPPEDSEDSEEEDDE